MNNAIITETTGKLEAFVDSMEEQFSLNPVGHRQTKIELQTL